MDANDQLDDVPETAQRLHVPASWLYGRIHTKSLPFPYVKVGHYVRFRRTDILDYIRRSTVVQGAA